MAGVITALRRWGPALLLLVALGLVGTCAYSGARWLDRQFRSETTDSLALRQRRAEVRVDSILRSRDQQRARDSVTAQADTRDSLALVRAQQDSRRAAAQLGVVTRQLARLRAEQTTAAAELDSLPALGSVAPADSIVWYQRVTYRQARVIGTQAELLGAYQRAEVPRERYIASLVQERDQAMNSLARVRGERDRMQRERDLATDALDSLRTLQKAVRDARRCTLGIPCPEVTMRLGYAAAGPSASVGMLVGAGRKVGVSLNAGQRFGDRAGSFVMADVRVRLARLRI